MADPTETSQSRLQDFFRLAEQFTRGWSGGFLDVAIRRAELGEVVQSAVHPLCVRQLRSLRSVVSVCEIGDAPSAWQIVRSMFETTLTVSFLMKPTWVHQVKSKKEKWSRELRAQLYLAYTAQEAARLASRLADKGNRKSQAAVPLVESTVDLPSLLKEIPTPLTKMLGSSPFTYSGLTLQELASQVGPEFEAWYSVVEGDLPEHHHAIDGSEFTESSPDHAPVSRWSSEDLPLQQVLASALYLTLALLNQLDQHADIGIGARSMLIGLREKLKALRS